MILSKRAECHSKNLKFINEQEASDSLCSLGIKIPLG